MLHDHSCDKSKMRLLISSFCNVVQTSGSRNFCDEEWIVSDSDGQKNVPAFPIFTYALSSVYSAGK